MVSWLIQWQRYEVINVKWLKIGNLPCLILECLCNSVFDGLLCFMSEDARVAIAMSLYASIPCRPFPPNSSIYLSQDYCKVFCVYDYLDNHFLIIKIYLTLLTLLF